MKILVEALEFERLYREGIVTAVCAAWGATLLTVIFASMAVGRPSYYQLVESSMQSSLVAIAFSYLAQKHYNKEMAVVATFASIFASLLTGEGVKFAIGELSTCRELYADQDAIATVQKAYTDMIKAGTTQVSVHTLQSVLSSRSIAAYGNYQCIGIANSNHVVRDGHAAILVILCVVTIISSLVVTVIFTSQSESMKKYARRFGQVVSSVWKSTKEYVNEHKSGKDS